MGLLPFIEQQAMADRYQVWPRTYAESANFPVTTAQIATYTCPSDSNTANVSLYSGVTFHNYVANYGNTTCSRAATLGTDSAGNPNRFGGAPIVGMVIGVGSYNDKTYVPTGVKMADVWDGTSNTLLFSETVQGRGGDLRGFAWWGYGCHFETYLPPNSAEPDRVQFDSYCKPNEPGNPPCVGATPSWTEQTIAARGRHPGGVNAALCDGSVRFIANTIRLDTWQRERSVARKCSESSNSLSAWPCPVVERLGTVPRPCTVTMTAKGFCAMSTCDCLCWPRGSFRFLPSRRCRLFRRHNPSTTWWSTAGHRPAWPPPCRPADG